MASGASVSSSSRSTSDASSSSASSIDAEAATGGGSSEPSMHSLCKRLAKKLSVGLEDCISCAEHRKASEIMASLKARLMDPSTAELDGASKIALTCTGVFISKRIVCGDEPEESIKDLKRTLTLLFVLIVLSNRPRSSFQPREGEDEEDAVMEDTEGMEDGEGMEDREGTADVRSDEEKSLGDWECGCFFDCMKESEAQLAVADDLKTKELTSAHICRSSMLVADQKADVLDFEKISTLAGYFFNQSSIAMTLQIFNGASKPVDDFLTLSSMSFLASVSSTNDTKLAAIADIAESESGQSVRGSASAYPPETCFKKQKLTQKNCPRLVSGAQRFHLVLHPAAQGGRRQKDVSFDSGSKQPRHQGVPLCSWRSTRRGHARRRIQLC